MIVLREIPRGQVRIMHIEIDRPKRRHAIDCQSMDEWSRHLSELEEATDIVALILTSTGEDIFIAGGDLRDFDKLKTRSEAFQMHDKMTRILRRLESLPYPVIAAIEGDVYGGGCEVMMACDFRIMSETSRIYWSQGRFGLLPGWGGATRLRQKIGYTRALKVLLEARAIHADQAYEMGMIDEVVARGEAMTCSLKWIQSWEQGSLSWIRRVKAALRGGFEEEGKYFVETWTSREHWQRVRAFWERERKR